MVWALSCGLVWSLINAERLSSWGMVKKVTLLILPSLTTMAICKLPYGVVSVVPLCVPSFNVFAVAVGCLLVAVGVSVVASVVFGCGIAELSLATADCSYVMAVDSFFVGHNAMAPAPKTASPRRLLAGADRHATNNKPGARPGLVAAGAACGQAPPLCTSSGISLDAA